MTRYLRLWWPCALLTWVIVPLATLLVDGRVDLTIEQFARLVCIPAAQATCLLVLTGRVPRRGAAHRRVHATPGQHTWARGVGLASVAVVAVAWATRAHPAIGVSAARPLLVTWGGTLLLAAGGVLGWGSLRGQVPAQARRQTAWLAFALLALGVETMTGAGNRAMGWALPLPTVLRWLLVYGVLLMGLLALAGRVADAWRQAGAGSEATWLDGAALAGAYVAAAWVLNAFMRPYWVGGTGFLVLSAFVVVGAAALAAALPLGVPE